MFTINHDGEKDLSTREIKNINVHFFDQKKIERSVHTDHY